MAIAGAELAIEAKGVGRDQIGLQEGGPIFGEKQVAPDTVGEEQGPKARAFVTAAADGIIDAAG